MLDPIALIWINLWLAIGGYGLYLLLTDNKSASKLYVYGKSLDLKHMNGLFWNLFLVPKRFFLHFYVTALAIFTTSLALITIYFVPCRISLRLQEAASLANHYMDLYNIDITRTTSLDAITSSLFTVILMIIQSSRRLIESSSISVYSSKSKINIIHYLFGHLFYILTALGTLVPILLSHTARKFTLTIILDHLVTTPRATLFILFVYASIYQQKCHKILANLRKDKTGRVITEQYFVPSGGPFEYVTCPHFLFEVILYFLILCVQKFANYYWNLTFLLVITTQTINAITEHKWYKKQYKDYPKEKKAIFPRLI